MNAFQSMQRSYASKFGRSTGDFERDRLREMYADDELAKEQAFTKAETARLENRAIMRKEMAKREENAKHPNTGMPDPDWKPGIPGDMLTREQNPWKTFYDNEALRGNYAALAGEGMPSPGGAHLMGSGGVIGSAGDAERAEAPRQAAAAMQALQAQGSGGGGGGGNAGGTGGQVTMSPGGNYSRGAAWNEFDFLRQRLGEAQARSAEQNVPSVKADRERNESAFRRNTGIADIEAEQAGREAGITTGTADEVKRRIASRTYFDPDVYRQMESEDRRRIEAGDPGREAAALKSQYDLAGKQAQADATMEAARLKSESAQLIAVLSGVRQAAASRVQGSAFGSKPEDLKALDDAITYLKQFGGAPQPNLPGLIR